VLLLPHSHIPLKNCAPIRKQYENEVLGLTHSTNHVTVSELMELVEDIARVKKRACMHEKRLVKDGKIA